MVDLIEKMEHQCSLSLKDQKKRFLQNPKTEKIVNPLNSSDNESLKFLTKKWYVIHNQNSTDYDEGNINGTSIKSVRKKIKSSPSDYSDAYILVTGHIMATDGDADTNVAFKNCIICKMHNPLKRRTY